MDDGPDAVEFSAFTMVARRRRKVIVDARSELIGAVPQIGDVAVGECDVLAGGSAVILVRGPARVVFSGPELTEGLRGVEDAGHGPARIDLEERIADQVTGLVVVGEHASGEGVVGGLDAVAVVASGRAADVFTEPLVRRRWLSARVSRRTSQSSQACSSGKPES
jgi:hypothetical protein